MTDLTASFMQENQTARKVNKIPAVAEMDDRLTTIDMGRKVGCCCTPFPWGSRFPT